MTLEELVVEAERELALYALSGRVPERFCRDWFVPRLGFLVGRSIRVPRHLMPSWYLARWSDFTQLDGRASVGEIDSLLISVLGRDPRLEDGTRYHIDMARFMDAVLARQVVEAA